MTEHDALQAELDAHWARLLANDPETVIGTLAEAFEDNAAPSAPVGVDGSEVSLVVMVPPKAATIPGRRVTRATAAPPGNYHIRALALQGLTGGYYLDGVASHALVTVKEAFAVAGNIASATVVVLRNAGRDSYGHLRVECILATRIRREALAGIQWKSTSATMILSDASDDTLIRPEWASGNLLPLKLTAEPEIRAILDVVDVDELGHSE